MQLILSLKITACFLMLGTVNGAVACEILSIGASNTYGKGVERHQAYPAHLKELLEKRGLSVDVKNAGVNGELTGDMGRRLKRTVTDETCLVIIQPGGNDRRKGISQNRRAKNIAKMIRYLEDQDIPFIILKNRLIGEVAKKYARPDGQHFLSSGYRALAKRLVPSVLQKLK